MVIASQKGMNMSALINRAVLKATPRSMMIKRERKNKVDAFTAWGATAVLGVFLLVGFFA